MDVLIFSELTQDFIDIAKYFGQSTADGIQFQFRTIKKDADKLRATADGGGDPSTCLDLNAATSSSFTPTTTPRTPRSRNFGTPTTGGGTVSTKRGRVAPTTVKIESDEDDDDSESTHNWSEMEATPSKRPRKHNDAAATPGQKNGTPSRLAAARASATIADTSAQLQTSDSEAEMPPFVLPITSLPTHTRNGTQQSVRPSSAFATPSYSVQQQQQQQQQRAAPSLFGSVPAFQQPASQPPPQPLSSSSQFAGHDAFRKTGRDAFVGSNGGHDDFSKPAGNAFDDEADHHIHGEI